MIPKVKKLSLNKQLTKIMVELIESGQWRLGEKLPNENDLSSSFNVSRNILRESMKILENFGVLNSKPGIGSFVSENALVNICNMNFFEELKNNSTVENIMEARLIIEPELAYYATVRCTLNEIKELKVICDSINKKREVTNYSYDDDFEFHLKLAQVSRNNLCEGFVQSLLSQLKNSDYSKFNEHADIKVVETSRNDYMLIVDAMEKKDALLAKEIMYNHLFLMINVINSSYNTDMLLSKKIEKKRKLKNEIEI